MILTGRNLASVQKTADAILAAGGKAEVAEVDTMLKRLPLMKDIANAAVFLASDQAGKITGGTLDVTAGTTNALNYKIERIAIA